MTGKQLMEWMDSVLAEATTLPICESEPHREWIIEAHRLVGAMYDSLKRYEGQKFVRIE